MVMVLRVLVGEGREASEERGEGREAFYGKVATNGDLLRVGRFLDGFLVFRSVSEALCVLGWVFCFFVRFPQALASSSHTNATHAHTRAFKYTNEIRRLFQRVWWLSNPLLRYTREEAHDT